MKKVKTDSWGSIVTRNKDFIARKTVGYSVFEHGTVVPQRYQENFLKNLSKDLVKGTSIPIKLIIDDIEYDSKIDNPNSKGRNDDLVRLMFGKVFKEVIRKKLKISYSYIMEHKNPKSKSQVLLPAEFEEFIDFYTGPEKDTFIVEPITRDYIIAHNADNNYIEINEDVLDSDEVDVMTELPEAGDDNVDVLTLENIFDNMSDGEDIYWFNSIIDELMIGNTNIPFKNIIIGIISQIWDIILKYDLNLCKDDKFKNILLEIKDKYLSGRNLTKDDIYNELIGLDDVNFDSMISGFYEYLPYKILAPFFQNELQGIKNDTERNKKIEELTIDNPTAIYEVNRKDKYIHIHENWIKYINDNEDILKQWIKEKMKEFLKSKNKGKEGLIDSIFATNDNKSKRLSELEVVNCDDVSKTIDEINGYIKSQGFTYSKELIKNLYLALKTKPFVILSGISGTGKSKIIELFAAAIGACEENKLFKLVPVKPEWSDSSDLLGYRNLEGQFVPGIITSMAKRAIDNPNLPHFICLDEMNLARVEYYFSDILSVMESRSFENNTIKSHRLLDDSVFDSDNKARDLYGKLYFPSNLYIVGTVNMDETTFPFSKKVLDRANVIEFNKVDLAFDFEDIIYEHNDFINQGKVYNNNLIMSEFIKISQCIEYKDTAVKVINELIKVNNILEKFNAHFGYRVRDEIVFYVIYAVRDNLMTFEEAMDFCILQKILPKIGGSSNEILEILLDLFEALSEYKIPNREYLDNKDIDNIYNKLFRSSYDSLDIKYELSCKKLLYMIRRFNNESFTTFYM